MISAQWGKGNGGLYRYYRCTKKSGVCNEPYTREQLVVSQCLEALKRLAVTPEQAETLRNLIDRESQNDGDTNNAAIDNINEQLAGLQTKLNKLTRGYLDEVIDQESYEAAKLDLVTEKASLKREKERLSKSRSSCWNEPAKRFINALESAGKLQSGESLQEISELVRKVGTNRQLVSKTVSFTLSEEYEFTASLLGNLTVSTSENQSPRSSADFESSIWCVRQDLNL